MKKFALKLVLFFLPFLTLIGIELFILPIDTFTFRVWEALVVMKHRKMFSGLLYPNMEVVKIEEGDLAPHTRFAVKKKVKWITDRYGYRKRNSDLERYKVVIIGESNIAGSGLTQEEILSEVLENQLRSGVYPYAPVAGISSFLRDDRFIKNPPDILVYARIEREILGLSPLRPIKKKDKLFSGFRRRFQQNRVVQSVAIQLDRLSKRIMLHFLRASLRRAISGPEYLGPGPVSSPYGPIFFLQGVKANEDVPKEELDKAIQIIRSYNDAVKRRGIRFIFLPIPNKENILYDYLRTKRPVYLERLISELNGCGVETIDTQKAFEEAFRKNQVLLYHTDDTHWNRDGVRIVADLLAKAIEEKGRTLPHS